MRSHWFAALACAALLAAGPAAAGEKAIQAKGLPSAVRNAVEEHSKGATLVGMSKETEGGQTFYEAELKIGDRTKDVTFDSDGNVVIVEEETSLDSIPEAARETILRVVGKRKLLLVETVSEKGAVFYEAHYKVGFLPKELKVDEAGKVVK